MKPLNILSIILLISLSISCGTTKNQTKEYRTNIFHADKTTVKKAIVSALYDEDLTVDFIDNESGILNASKSEATSLGYKFGQILGQALVDSDSVSTTTDNIDKMYFYMEPIDVNTTQVKLIVKYGSHHDRNNSYEESNDKSYSEYTSDNKETYQYWFSKIALEVKKRLDKEAALLIE